MKVTVNPINTVTVKVNQQSQQFVSGTSQFVGSAGGVVAQALALANAAITIANQANANVALKYDKTGGPITGDVQISGNTSIGGIITASNEIIDAGGF